MNPRPTYPNHQASTTMPLWRVFKGELIIYLTIITLPPHSPLTHVLHLHPFTTHDLPISISYPVTISYSYSYVIIVLDIYRSYCSDIDYRSRFYSLFRLLSLSVYMWGIFLAYIRRRLSSRPRFHVFWEAGRDYCQIVCL